MVSNCSVCVDGSRAPSLPFSICLFGNAFVIFSTVGRILKQIESVYAIMVLKCNLTDLYVNHIQFSVQGANVETTEGTNNVDFYHHHHHHHHHHHGNHNDHNQYYRHQHCLYYRCHRRCSYCSMKKETGSNYL
uniref:Uncharacterized protein n=1 Tax=Glossina austeni TaxID=7395 RepID=A0A1A9VEE7_GLOAU